MNLPRLHTFKLKYKDGENEIDREFFLRKPNRRLFEEGELFQGKTLNQAITKYGLIPRALLAKTLTENGGVYTDKEKEHYKNLLIKIRDLESEYQSILLKEKEVLSEKEKTRLDEINEELIQTKSIIRDYELQEDSLYESTAESYARRKYMFWWVINLSYEAIDDKEDLVLKGDSYDSKMDFYDLIIDQDPDFWRTVFAKFTYYVAVWMNPTINGDSEAFKKALEILEQESKSSDKEDVETPEIKEENTET